MSKKKQALQTNPSVQAILDALAHVRLSQGFFVVNTIGPYDHNPYDYPLPAKDFVKVFRALHEAVDYAREMRRQGIEKMSIHMTDGSFVPKTKLLATQVVWRSWNKKDAVYLDRRDPRRRTGR